MRKEKSLIIIGFWILVFPFLGFPNSWKIILLEITGIVIIYIAYLFYLEVKEQISKVDDQTKSFVDNINNEE